MVSKGSLCCRYCGHLFEESDIPKDYYKQFYDMFKKEYYDENIGWEHRRCPSCLHVLDYEIEKGLSQAYVYKMQYRINPDTEYFEFRNEKKYVRKD